MGLYRKLTKCIFKPKPKYLTFTRSDYSIKRIPIHFSVPTIACLHMWDDRYSIETTLPITPLQLFRKKGKYSFLYSF